MKTLKPVLLVVALLSMLIIAGCQEAYTSHSYTTENFIWEQSATGFWQPNVNHVHSGYSK
ncbi:MAG: hypothetical protein JW837_16020 [Sedimentisphaerales bacterium]|nr:hypothetical protein [Sedimentisphaerales bacterium]